MTSLLISYHFWNVHTYFLSSTYFYKQQRYVTVSCKILLWNILISDGAKFGTINKSRYGSVSSFLSDCSLKGDFNDIDLVHDPETYQILKEAGINELMAKHISHLFIRYVTSKVILRPYTIQFITHMWNLRKFTNFQIIQFWWIETC